MVLLFVLKETRGLPVEVYFLLFLLLDLELLVEFFEGDAPRATGRTSGAT